MGLRFLTSRFRRRTDGHDLIEYALIATIISIFAYLGIVQLGNSLAGALDATATAVTAPGGGTTGTTGGTTGGGRGTGGGSGGRGTGGRGTGGGGP